jgi:hypothetical protein
MLQCELGCGWSRHSESDLVGCSVFHLDASSLSCTSVSKDGVLKATCLSAIFLLALGPSLALADTKPAAHPAAASHPAAVSHPATAAHPVVPGARPATSVHSAFRGPARPVGRPGLAAPGVRGAYGVHPGAAEHPLAHGYRAGEIYKPRAAEGQAHHYEARHYEARHYEARHDEGRHYEARHDEGRHYEARHDEERRHEDLHRDAFHDHRGERRELYGFHHYRVWEWHHGLAWAPDHAYWGGGFWGPVALGVAFGAVIVIATDSPGHIVLQNYGLVEVVCDPDAGQVVLYGPNGSVVCATPNDSVQPGNYNVDPSTLNLEPTTEE